jgi:copper resistance protein B
LIGSRPGTVIASMTGICVVALLDVGAAGAQPAAPGNAADETSPMPGEDDAEMNMSAMQGGSAPPDARDPNAYSDGVDFTMGPARPRFADARSYGSVLVEKLEATRVDGHTSVPYDLEAWFGRTFERAVLKSEGDIESGDLAEARSELLWGHAFAPYWDTQLGLRHDSGEGPNRSWLAFGIEGLAPYRFEVDLTGYIGESSRTALRLDASYEMLITQRLVLQPRLEADFYGKNDPARGLGSGLSEVSVGLRLRYEFRRERAPYIGIERITEHGRTADLTRAAGGDPSDTRIIIGLRFWY